VSHIRRLLLVATTLAALLVASGCGKGEPHTATWRPPARQPIHITPASTHPSVKPINTTAPMVVNHGPRTGHAVSLTFDADMTPEMAHRLDTGQARSFANLKVLDILEQGSIPATFFITGMWAERYPDVMRRLAGNPRFEFGNHTWDHRAYTNDCYHLDQVPRAEMASEISRTFDIIAPYGGHQTRYFRFPGLCYNAAALAAIAPENVTVIQGDVVSGDPMATAWQPIVKAVLDHVQPGSIVVLHITQDNAKMTDQALPPILDGLRAKGLQPVRLSELLAP
jgi:peptidoglycan/xylan/chitin deacetylase (PgdA/CDA1 family)